MSLWYKIKSVFGFGTKEAAPTPVLAIKPDVAPPQKPQPTPAQVEVSLDPFFFEIDALKAKLDKNQKAYFSKLVSAYMAASLPGEKVAAKLKVENYMTKHK